MEGVEMEAKEEAPKSQISIRCAKAAMLLLSLKSFRTRRPNDDEDEEREMLKRVISDLKIEVVRERMKNRRMRLCSSMEVLLQIVVVLSLWSFCLMLAFTYYSNDTHLR